MSRFDDIGRLNIPPPREIETKESAPLPSTLKEFREATENALDFGDKHLGLWSADGTELSTIAFEEWTDVTMKLDEIFFELNNGILGTQLLNFAKLDRSEIELLLAQTAPLARRMNPLIDRLCALNPTMTRADVIATLREGEVLATETLDYTSKQPLRRSLLGILHDLGERLGSTLWDFNQQEKKKLAPVIVLSDPFATDATSQEYWKDRIDEPIIKRSEQKTQAIIYEFENLRQTIEKACPSKPCEDGKELMTALDVIESWLESNMILYRDGKEVDFSLYHLGMETPTDIDAILGSLDTIKRDNPEFFVQLMGINPAGGKSPYFGSFIHKALFNTQNVVNETESSASNLFLKSSLQQLLMINGHVQRWDFDETISEESIKELARRMEERIAEEPTDAGKNQLRMLLATMLVKPTIEVEVKRQLKEMKEVNIKQLKDELIKKLDDHEHLMLALKAVSMLPLIAFRDPSIKSRLTAIFGEEAMEDSTELQEQCKKEDAKVVRAIFNQIPMFDYENAKLGNFFSIAIREAKAREGAIERMRQSMRGEKRWKSEEFFGNILLDRVATRALAYGSLKTKAERKFFERLWDEFPKATKIWDFDLEDTVARPEGGREKILPWDRALCDALRFQFSQAPENPSEEELDEGRDTAIVLATLQQRKGARVLMDEFGTFVLRKKDAGRAVKIMFEHLEKSSEISYRQFDFLWKYAEKFLPNDLEKLLKSIPVNKELLRGMVMFAEAEYPVTFDAYFRKLELGTAQYVGDGRPLTTGVIQDLLEQKRKNTDATWTEDRVFNFARIPAFSEQFKKHAKEIFELYPDLSKKLYGDWGARAIKEFKIVETRADLLREWPKFCPKDGNDNLKEKYRMLMKAQYVMGGSFCLNVMASFERNFPELKNEKYQEMRELFGERLLGFAEVEKAFAGGLTIGESEYSSAIKQLEEKLEEPDVQRFLKHLKEKPEEAKNWMLVYRCASPLSFNSLTSDRGMRFGLGLETRYTLDEKVWTGEPIRAGWYFVQREPESLTEKEQKGEEQIEQNIKKTLKRIAMDWGMDLGKIQRRTPGEAFYDSMIATAMGVNVLEKHNERTAEKMRGWGAERAIEHMVNIYIREGQSTKSPNLDTGMVGKIDARAGVCLTR